MGESGRRQLATPTRKPPQSRRLFLFQQGVGYFKVGGSASGAWRLQGEVRGRGCRVAWEVLPMGHRVLLRQRGT